MSTVVVSHKHNLTPEEAKSRLGAFEAEVAEKYGMRVEWSGLNAALKGTGVSGDVKVTDHDVTITVKLGLLVRAVVKPDKLEASLMKRMRAAFGDNTGSTA